MWPEPLERGLAGDAEGDADGCPGVAGGAGSIHCGPQLRFGCLDRFFRGDDAPQVAGIVGVGRVGLDREAAEYLAVTDRTVRQMIADGRLRGYRSGTRLVRLRRDEVDGAMHPFGGAA